MIKSNRNPAKFTSFVAMAALAATFVSIPDYAKAKKHNLLIGIGIGALIGGAIVSGSQRANENRANRRSPQYRPNRRPPHYKSKTYRNPNSKKRTLANARRSIGATSKAEVIRIQSSLVALGYDTRGIDGKVGRGTRTAIRNFQRDQRIAVTGRLDEMQKSLLYARANNQGNGQTPGFVDDRRIPASAGAGGTILTSVPEETNIFGETLAGPSDNSRPFEITPEINSGPGAVPQEKKLNIWGDEITDPSATYQQPENTGSPGVAGPQTVPVETAPQSVPSPVVNESELATIFDGGDFSGSQEEKLALDKPRF